MTQSLRRHLWPSLFAIGLMVATAAPSGAQSIDIHAGSGGHASIQITFGDEPRWVAVPNSRVRIIEVRDRPDYDMFRYGNRYYVCRDGYWYMSRHPRGRFVWVDEYRVPVEISRVPRKHWRRYPGHWDDRRRDPRPRHGNDHRDRDRGRDERGRDDHDDDRGGNRRYK